jgi:hypothetical protein
MPVIHFTQYTYEAVLCQRNKDGGLISEELVRSIDGEFKLCLHRLFGISIKYKLYGISKMKSKGKIFNGNLKLCGVLYCH